MDELMFILDLTMILMFRMLSSTLKFHPMNVKNVLGFNKTIRIDR